jgi:tetratricopeptide (TPR) repeat protein
MCRQKCFQLLGWAVFVCLLSTSRPAFAQAIPVFAKEFAAQKEVFQIKLDNLKEAQKNDVDSLNKRIDDALTKSGQAVDRFGVIMTLIGSLVTVLLAGLGLLGFISVTRKTKAEAEQAAQAWFNEKTTILLREIEQLEKRVQEAHLSLDASVKSVDDHAFEAKQAISRQQAEMGQPRDDQAQRSTPGREDISVLNRRDKELRQQPEASYSFDDWNARAHAAYASDKLTDAIYFWARASQVEGAGAANVATALLNKGITQDRLDDNAGAIESYNEVIRRYGDAPEATLREQVAKALLNKGVSQGKTGDDAGVVESNNEVIRRYGDAPEAALREQVAKALINKGLHQGKAGDIAGGIESCNEVISRYGDSPEAALREKVARALLHKGVNQGKTGDNAGAIESYNEVIRRYGDAPETDLRELVAKAHNGFGWNHFVEAKRLWITNRVAAEQCLQQARQQFEDGITRAVVPDGMILGNRAYTRFLQGDIEGAEVDFGAALAAESHGGKWLFEVTQKDIDEHPLDEDVGMRAMVERLWKAYEAAGIGCAEP